MFITLLGAALLFLAVVANRPLKRMLEHERLELEARVAEAQRGSDEANAQAALAKERAAQANERAEQERLARIRIEERLAGRHISSEDHRKFVGVLKEHPGTVDFTKIGDLEAGKFADEILRIFQEAKWKVITNYTGTFSPPLYGVDCKVDSTPSGQALAKVLKQLPTASVRVVNSNPQEPDIHGQVVVGLKPPP